MNRDVKILRRLAYHLSALPRPGVISISDNDRLAMALMKTSDELHAEDVQELKAERAAEDVYSEACALDSPFNPDNAEAPSPVGNEARRLRQVLEKLLSASEFSDCLNKGNVVYEFNNVPDRESQDYLKQRGGSHEAHCLRTGVAALLSKDSSSNYISKFDIMHLFEEISPSESNFYPRRGYHSDRYRK